VLYIGCGIFYLIIPMMNNSAENCDSSLTVKSKSQLSIRLLNIEERDIWDNLAKTAPFGCFMQGWAWADFKELEGYKTFRYGLFEEKLICGCIFYYYPNPGKANLLLATGGPILPLEYRAAGMQMLLETARKLAKELGAIALRIEPLWSEKPGYLEGFARAPADLLPSETLLVDLRASETEILAAMKPKGRYNLRLSQRRGVEIEFTATRKLSLYFTIFF
jgi:lipid II:glycine glycyltransferase (peptidoglycan interpeptide bridge formation enzyme)